MLKPESVSFCSTTSGGRMRVATAISRGVGAGWALGSANAGVASAAASHKAAASRPRTVHMFDLMMLEGMRYCWRPKPACRYRHMLKRRSQYATTALQIYGRRLLIHIAILPAGRKHFLRSIDPRAAGLGDAGEQRRLLPQIGPQLVERERLHLATGIGDDLGHVGRRHHLLRFFVQLRNNVPWHAA